MAQGPLNPATAYFWPFGPREVWRLVWRTLEGPSQSPAGGSAPPANLALFEDGTTEILFEDDTPMAFEQ